MFSNTSTPETANVKPSCESLKLYQTNPTAVVEALSKAGLQVVEQIDTVSEAAMWKAGKVKSRTAQRMLRRHLRHHLGENVVGPEHDLMNLRKGYTDVHCDTHSTRRS